MARDSNPRARGKRPADDDMSDSTSPAKRRKKAGAQDDSRAVLPNAVASAPVSCTSQPVSSQRKAVAAFSSQQVPMSCTSSTTAASVLPTLPDATKRRQQTHQNNEKQQTKATFKSSNNPESNNYKASSKQGIPNKDVRKNASKMTAWATVDKRHEGKSVPSHRCRTTDASTLCRRLASVALVAFFLFDMYQTSLYQSPSATLNDKSTLWSNNATTTPMLQVTLHDDVIRRVPHHKVNTVVSHHLLELEDYARQESLLYETEKQLAKARAELADSRHDAVAARRQITQVQDAYASVASELEQSQQQVTNYQRRLELALHELSYTRDELERTQLDLTSANVDLESLSEQLNEAYQALELQEAVAVHTLNFVATAAVQQRQQDKQALNKEQDAAMSPNL